MEDGDLAKKLNSLWWKANVSKSRLYDFVIMANPSYKLNGQPFSDFVFDWKSEDPHIAGSSALFSFFFLFSFNSIYWQWFIIHSTHRDNTFRNKPNMLLFWSQSCTDTSSVQFEPFLLTVRELNLHPFIDRFTFRKSESCYTGKAATALASTLRFH